MALPGFITDYVHTVIAIINGGAEIPVYSRTWLGTNTFGGSLSSADMQMGGYLRHAASQPAAVPTADGLELSIRRANSITATDEAPSIGMFLTPTNLKQGDIFVLKATFTAPSGPMNAENAWAINVQFRDGNLDDFKSAKRGTSHIQHRCQGVVCTNEAILKAFGQTPPATSEMLTADEYARLYDEQPRIPFTLCLLVDRKLACGQAWVSVNGAAMAAFSVQYDDATMSKNGTTVDVVGVALVSADGSDDTTAKVTLQQFDVSLYPAPKLWMVGITFWRMIRFRLAGWALRHPRMVNERVS